MGVAALVVAAIAGIVLLLFAATGSAKRKDKPVPQRAKVGGTVYFAELPSTVPNYIFPFMSLAFFSVDNISQLQQLMYRPLYWFGKGTQPGPEPRRLAGATPEVLEGQHRRDASR